MLDEYAEMLLRGEKLPPDLPRVDAIAAWLRAHELRVERNKCCVCGYSETTEIEGKRYCFWHKPERKVR